MNDHFFNPLLHILATIFSPYPSCWESKLVIKLSLVFIFSYICLHTISCVSQIKSNQIILFSKIRYIYLEVFIDVNHDSATLKKANYNYCFKIFYLFFIYSSYVMLSSKISRKSEKLILRYSKTKEVFPFDSFCFGNSLIADIF